jgi:pyruvate/2-oxoglutarate dehydrogenase complex dihydrolipoamide dehydrogenase (E3) component
LTFFRAAAFTQTILMSVAFFVVYKGARRTEQRRACVRLSRRICDAAHRRGWPFLETDKRAFIKVNERLETTASGIWALGDVNGGPQFTHASLDDYRIVKGNVFGEGKRTTVDRLVPFTLFTEPELARVGLTEKEAQQKELNIFVAKLPVPAILRAKTMSEMRGFIKAAIDAKTNRILGCAILSIEAGEMLGTVQMAMIAGLPFTALRDAVLSHPTMVEGFNNLPTNSG